LQQGGSGFTDRQTRATGESSGRDLAGQGRAAQHKRGARPRREPAEINLYFPASSGGAGHKRRAAHGYIRHGAHVAIFNHIRLRWEQLREVGAALFYQQGG
jgi:hypothetical protein